MRSERDVVMHSWCIQNDWNAPEVVGGRGARFITADGHELIDMSSLAECSNLGHQHPSVVAAIRAQAETLCFVTSEWGAEPRRALAEALLDRSGFTDGRVFFTLGGADANENAVKFARWASGKPLGKIITRHRSYHGASPATISLSGDARAAAQPLGMPGVVHALPPYCYRCPFGLTQPDCNVRCADHIADLFAWEDPATVAAVLMEPHAGTNGIVAPADYWPRLAAQCRTHAIWLIADEVMSGFGRTGEWFAWQRYGEAGRPDMMTLAKGLTGAHLPLGAVVASRAVCERLEDRMLYTGLTYCGHPLSCAAGLAALKAYEDEALIARSRTLGGQLHTRLRDLMVHHAVIGDVRGDGLFAIVELVRNRATREPLVAWSGGDRTLKSLVARGRAAGVSFAVRGNLIVIAPPLVITESDLDHALGVLDCLLGELSPDLPPAASGA